MNLNRLKERYHPEMYEQSNIEFRPVNEHLVEVHVLIDGGSVYFGDLITHGGKWVVSSSNLCMLIAKQHMDWDNDIKIIYSKLDDLNEHQPNNHG